MSGATPREAGADPDSTPEDFRRIAQELRENGLRILPGKLDDYADKLEAENQ